MNGKKVRRPDQESTPKTAPPADRSSYVPGTLAGATLAGVAVVILLSYMNWQETRQTQRTLEARLGQIDERIAQISKAAPAAAPVRGPDPNRVHSVKTEGAPVKGPKDAPISIVEFSDFQ
jgi:protein-disulfide isomerase